MPQYLQAHFCMSVIVSDNLWTPYNTPVAPHRWLCLVGAGGCPISSVYLPAVWLPEHCVHHILWLHRESHALTGQYLCWSFVCGANSRDLWRQYLVSGNFHHRVHTVWLWLFDNAEKWYTNEFFGKAVGFIRHVQLNIYEHTMYVYYTCMVIHACKITQNRMCVYTFLCFAEVYWHVCVYYCTIVQLCSALPSPPRLMLSMMIYWTHSFHKWPYHCSSVLASLCRS